MSRDSIVLIGQTRVGKTQVMNRLKDSPFVDIDIPTEGATDDFCLSDEKKLLFWDVGGNKRYFNLAKAYYKNAKLFVFCFALDDKSSLDYLNQFFEAIQGEENKSIPVLMVGTKSDLSATISDEDIQDYIQKKCESGYHVIKECIKTSAKNNEQIAQLKKTITSLYEKPLTVNRESMRVLAEDPSAKSNCPPASLIFPLVANAMGAGLIVAAIVVFIFSTAPISLPLLLLGGGTALLAGSLFNPCRCLMGSNNQIETVSEVEEAEEQLTV